MFSVPPELYNSFRRAIDRWVRQFDEFGFDDKAQVVLLGEMEGILKRYYISRSLAQDFITRVLTSQKLFGATPAETIRNVQFLRIQTKGSSQNDLLNLCEQILQSEHGFGLADCGSNLNLTSMIPSESCCHI